jgi:DNA segregation ATPase FtsK/SpoIIIE, S-DNA-T family
MNDLDPTKAENREDLAEYLKQLRLRAGKPTYRELERQTIHAQGQLPGTRLKRVMLGRTTLSDVLLGRKFPSKAFMLTLVEALGIDLENDSRWYQAWNKVAEMFQGPMAEVDQLHQQLAQAQARAEEAAAEIEALRRLATNARAQADAADSPYIGDLAATGPQGPPPRVLDEYAGSLHNSGRPGRRTRPPPGDVLTLSDLLGDVGRDRESGLRARGWYRPGTLCAPIGIIDRPFPQRRDVLTADFAGAGGHLAIVGAARAGKSTLLRTLISSLALTNTPDQAQFYCLDFGGGALAALSGLPHVGGVCDRRQPDLVRRTVGELSALLEEREALFANHQLESMTAYVEAANGRRNLDAPPLTDGQRTAHVFLVVDGSAVLRQEFEALESPIANLAAHGLAYGIHVIITANRWADISPKLKELLAIRYELRLAEPAESEVGSNAAASVPVGSPGRGLTSDAYHFMAALPLAGSLGDVTDLGGSVRSLCAAAAAAWRGRPAPPVRQLPPSLPLSAILGRPAATTAGIPFGIAEDDLGPVGADFSRDPHFLVFGDTASGKSNLLRVLADGIVRRNTPAQARLIIVDYRRSLLEAVDGDYLIGYAPTATAAQQTATDVAEAMRQRLPGPDVTPAQLRDRSWWTGPDLYLLVDDYDLVPTSASNPVGALLDVLPHSRDIGLHVVLARASSGAGRAAYEPVLQRMRDLGTPGLIMSGSKDEGHLIGGVSAQSMPPGRGLLVSRNQPFRRVQVALLEPGP